MSNTTGALSQASSGIGFGMVVRLVAVGLGIMSATLIAVNGFQIPINEAFVELLSGVREFAGDIVWPIEKAIVMPIVSWLHARDFVFVLHDHWKQAFVLLWLHFSSNARESTPAQGFGETTFGWFWSGSCALAFGVLAGTVPLSDPAVFWWPAAGYFTYRAGSDAWVATFRPNEGRSWIQDFLELGAVEFALAATCALAAVVARTVPLASDPDAFWWPFVGYYLYVVGLWAARNYFNWPAALTVGVFVSLAARVLPEVNLVFATSPSPGLAAFFAFVGIEAANCLLYGLLWGNLDRKELRDYFTRIGLNVLAVLSGAAFIVWLGHAAA